MTELQLLPLIQLVCIMIIITFGLVVILILYIALTVNFVYVYTVFVNQELIFYWCQIELSLSRAISKKEAFTLQSCSSTAMFKAVEVEDKLVLLSLAEERKILDNDEIAACKGAVQQNIGKT